MRKYGYRVSVGGKWREHAMCRQVAFQIHPFPLIKYILCEIVWVYRKKQHTEQLNFILISFYYYYLYFPLFICTHPMIFLLYTPFLIVHMQITHTHIHSRTSWNVYVSSLTLTIINVNLQIFASRTFENFHENYPFIANTDNVCGCLFVHFLKS